MPDKDVVMAKISTIKRCLNRIRETTNNDSDSLDNIDKQDIFVLNLQRCVQAVIDLATHIVASEGLGLPDTIKDNFRLLLEKGITDEELAVKMERMVGFRNIAVQNYQSIDKEILKSILREHLPDIEAFYDSVIKYFCWSKDRGHL